MVPKLGIVVIPVEVWMNATKILGLALAVAGILGLLYGGFTYTRSSHAANLGPIELTLRERETVNIPAWAGVGALVIGGALLVLGRKHA